MNDAPLTCQRALFDLEEGIVSMATASHSAILKSSIDVGQRGVAAKGRPWRLDDGRRRQEADDVRALFAGLIGAGADDIAIQPSVAFGIAAAAGNVALEKGQSILVLEDQFPSNVLIWRRLAADAGAEVVTVPRPASGDWTSAVMEHIDTKVALAALPPAHWTDGTCVDLNQISKALRDNGAMLVIDATQWIGVRPFDVKAIDPDFLICAAYKWLLSPYGLAFMYAAPRHHNGRPLEEHGNNHRGDSYAPGARRFDAGEFLNLVSLPMVKDSMTQITAWQPSRISAYVKPITDALADHAQDIGLEVADPRFRSPHILNVRPSEDLPDDILEQLMHRGVHVNARGGGLRISPYLHNDIEDVTIVSSALRDIFSKNIMKSAN